MIAAGSGAKGSGPGGAPDGWVQRALALGPVRHVGRVSYAWYLWHWPLLVFATAHWGHLSARAGLAVVALAYLPTIVTHRLVEERFRRSPSLAAVPARALRLGLVCTVLATGTAGVLRLATPMLPGAGTDAVGAEAMQRPAPMQTEATAVEPAPDAAAKDAGRMQAAGCQLRAPVKTSPPCVFGDASSGTTVVLFGDSHALMWSPALLRVAHRRGWRLIGLTKSGCPASTALVTSFVFQRAYTECATWRRHSLARIRRLHPDLVVVASRTNYTVVEDGSELGQDASGKALEAGFRSMLRTLKRISDRVTVIGDPPHHMDHAADCVAAHPDRLGLCAKPRSRTAAPQRLLEAAHAVGGVHGIDPTNRFCLPRRCPAVIGDVLVYRTTSHVTATYVATLTDWFDQRLRRLG